MLKANEPIFVYVNTHIINKIHHFMYTNHDKEYGGINSTRKGKGGRAKSLGKGISWRDYSQRNIIIYSKD
jgi:hypothetical protein